MIGYTKKLYILPFDHRGSFVKYLFGKKRINASERKLAEDYKKIIFEGFLSIWNKLPKYVREEYGVFLDDEFCNGIIRKARKKGIVFALAVEKSGQKLFNFEHGKNFGEDFEREKPDFIKALVRYNPENDDEDNELQLCRLKQLTDWCRENEYKLIIELLVPPRNGNLRRKFDEEARPGLTVRAIEEFYKKEIIPDIWKIEAMENKDDWKPVIRIIRRGVGRSKIGIIMLGRGGSFARVKQWIENCPKDRINGFAIGRTIWLRSLLDLKDKNITRKEATEQIGSNYRELVKLWEN